MLLQCMTTVLRGVACLLKRMEMLVGSLAARCPVGKLAHGPKSGLHGVVGKFCCQQEGASSPKPCCALLLAVCRSAVGMPLSAALVTLQEQHVGVFVLACGSQVLALIGSRLYTGGASRVTCFVLEAILGTDSAFQCGRRFSVIRWTVWCILSH